MNYQLIDTKTGKYGIFNSRKKIEIETGGQVTANMLVNLFWKNTKRPKGADSTYADDRFIVLPIPDRNIAYVDKSLIGRITSFKT